MPGNAGRHRLQKPRRSGAPAFVLVALLVLALGLATGVALGRYMIGSLSATIAADEQQNTPPEGSGADNTNPTGDSTAGGSDLATVNVQLPAISLWALQVGRFSTAANASRQATAAATAGFPAYTVPDANSYVVWAGLYTDKNAAEQAAKQAQKAKLEVYVAPVNLGGQLSIVAPTQTTDLLPTCFQNVANTITGLLPGLSATKTQNTDSTLAGQATSLLAALKNTRAALQAVNTTDQTISAVDSLLAQAKTTAEAALAWSQTGGAQPWQKAMVAMMTLTAKLMEITQTYQSP